MRIRLLSHALALSCVLAGVSVAAEFETNGSVSANLRVFNSEPADPLQQERYLAVSLEQEFSFGSGDNRFTLTPYFRYEEHDEARQLIDLREALWLHVGENFESRVGVSTVFWGVTESRHLVDIINQVDLIESIDGEVKLGQPMINMLFYSDWGDVDLYVLPYFRKRPFSEQAGRPRLGFLVDWENPVYESSAKENHVDLALRWSHSLGDSEIAVSHFAGTVREPLLVPRVTSEGIVLTPTYQQVQQTGLEYQYSRGDWLWKLEAIRQTGAGTFTAAVAGLEYNYVGLWDDIDFGLIVEYNFDDRGRFATTPYQNDTFFGTRIAINDARSTQILAGLLIDNDDQSRIVNIEARTRLSESVQLSVDLYAFSSPTPTDFFLHPLRNDDFIQLELTCFY